MGAIENKLRKQKREIKIKLDDLRDGVIKEYEDKLAALRENHTQARTRTSHDHAQELNKLRESLEHTIGVLTKDLEGLQERYGDRGKLIKTLTERTTQLETDVDAAKAKHEKLADEPKKLRKRLQRTREDTDNTIKKLRQELLDERRKSQGSWNSSAKRREAALEEFRMVVTRMLTAPPTPEDTVRIPQLLDALG